MGDITITGGISILDPEDMAFASGFKWRLDKGGYVVRGVREFGHYRLVRLHREIIERTGATINEGQIVDHINHIRHDNRRSNLRVASLSENNSNKLATSKTGITFSRKTRLYTVRVQKEGRSIYIGKFPFKEEAVYWRNEACKQLHGEFANLIVTDDIPNS